MFLGENMKIISLINSKGGVGKTTLAINLARYVQKYIYTQEHPKKKPSVLIVDADPQGSTRDWYETGGHQYIDVIVADRKSIITNLRQANIHYDYIFVDTGGKLSDIMAAAIATSDLVLVPVQPSPYDIWATEETINLVKMRQEITEGIPLCRYVLNRCIPNTNIGKDVIEHMNTYTHTHIMTRTIKHELSTWQTGKFAT